eukprot:gene2524-2885_t
MFHNGFAQYLTTGLYSDMTLIVNKKQGTDIFNQPSSPVLASSPSSTTTLSLLKTVATTTIVVIDNGGDGKQQDKDRIKSNEIIIITQVWRGKLSAFIADQHLANNIAKWIAASPMPISSSRKDSSSSSPSLLIPLSYIKQQFNSHHPKPSLSFTGTNLTIELEIQEEDSMFDQIITYMYKGKIDINDDNAIGILFFANHFLIHSLKKLVSSYIVEHINGSNVIKWLEKSIEFNLAELTPKCIFVIARNFTQIVESADRHRLFSSMPVDMFLTVLDSTSLSVFSEFTVYLAICNYIATKPTEYTPKQIDLLFRKVRFPYLTYQEYLQVIKNPLVPQDLLTEGLMVRLGNFECPHSPSLQKRLSDSRFMKRKTSGRIFEYSHDFDNKGVIYYLATNGYTSEWANPSIFPPDNPRVRITASSIEKGSLSDIVELRPLECWTKDVPSSWFCIDLGNSYVLTPKYYTLRHGGNSKQDCLRNWLLQASEDANEWFNISRHTNEPYLNANFASHSFAVQCSASYRFFRILQVSHNSSNHNFLSLSGFELYGDLYDREY